MAKCLQRLVGRFTGLFVRVFVFLIGLLPRGAPRVRRKREYDPLLLLPAVRLAQMLRDGETSSLKVVDAYIRQAEAINGELNAIVAFRSEQARTEAREADERLTAARKGSKKDHANLPPFLGVPCTIKECFAVKGMPHTAGVRSRVGTPAPEDAPAVARMRAAGFIILGVTNTSEACMWYESSNYVYGTTGNPYDASRIAGGSSGGEGCAVGSAMSPCGLGSDIGGSIRMPAFFNGIFGHKPTSLVVPNEGQWPCATGEATRYLCSGPLARYAADLMPLLRIMSTPPVSPSASLADPATVDISKLRVYSVPHLGGHLFVSAVVPDMREAHRMACERLQDAGATVTRQHFRAFERAFDLWSACLSASGTAPFRELINTPWPWVSLARWMGGQREHTFPAIFLAAVEGFGGLIPGRRRRLVERTARLREEVNNLLGDNGVLIFPSFPRTAPRHSYPLLTPLDFTYTGLFNVLELPVTQVPLGLSHEGLPVGVQVVGAHGRDHVTIAVAMELERACGGWVAPA